MPAFGRISGITTKQSAGSSPVTIASNAAYMPFGPLSGFTFGNGVALTLGYDQDYQLTGIVAANGATLYAPAPVKKKRRVLKPVLAPARA
ncbi:MAG TPA: hypothetical protein VLC74_10625 [Rhizomicrobium sp.]|nr:hypothetical protein [Rhizomicrobium sp.]